MENLELKAVGRDAAVKAKYVRQSGRIPAVVYGDKKENIVIDFDYQEFRKLYEKAGHNTLINLSIEGEKEPVEVLVHTVDYDPVTGEYAHVDIKRITRGVEVTTEVSVVFEGVSEAVKTLGGILVTNKEYLDIKCLPKDLIHEVKADISVLKELNDKIIVGDLEVPDTVTVLNGDDEVIVTVSAPRAIVEEEEETTAEGAEGEEGEGTEGAEGEGGETAEGEKSEEEGK